MIPLHNYLLFKQIAGLIFLAELVSIYPFFYRYFGLPYNPYSFVRSRATAVPTAIIVSGAALSIAMNAMPILGAFVLLCFYRYVHVDCRFASLSRGAGAVGLVPYYVVLYLFLLELSLFVDHSQQLFVYVSTVFRIDVATMVICAGVTKSLSGYARGEGVEYALVNPVWSNFPWFFNRFSPNSILFRFQNMNAMITQILGGILLLFPGTAFWGGLLIILVYVYVTIVINVALLGALMIAIGMVFLPEAGFSLLPQMTDSTQYEHIGESELITQAVYVLTTTYLAVCISIKLILYFQKYAGLKLPGTLHSIIQFISRHVPVFMWRVFTKDLSNDFIRIIEVFPEGRERVIFDEHLLSPRPLTGFIKHYRFWHPTEVVALTTIAHQFDHPGGFERAQAMLARYVQTLGPELSVSDSVVRFEVVNFVKRENAFQFGSICHLTFQHSGKLESIGNRE